MFEQYTYGTFFVDITSNCNLRCKYCVNDWSKIRGNINMSEETFKKVIALAPLSNDGRFSISCEFEPIIHPGYIYLIELIPEDAKRKTFFTTNLAKPIPKEHFESLSRTNIGYINISLDSFDATVFEELRAGAKFDVFISNLNTLTKVFEKSDNSPRVRFITMVFKQNMDELEILAETCSTKYNAVEHEFRTPFNWSLQYNDVEWLRRSIISEEECEELYKRLSESPYPLELSNYSYPKISPIETNRALNLQFHIRADGTVLFNDRDSSKCPEEFKKPFNINDIHNTYDYFKAILYKIQGGTNETN